MRPSTGRVLEDLRLQRARIFVVQGRLAEARAELAHVARPPRAYRLLAALPAPLVQGALALRRRLTGAGSAHPDTPKRAD